MPGGTTVMFDGRSRSRRTISSFDDSDSVTILELR